MNYTKEQAKQILNIVQQEALDLAAKSSVKEFINIEAFTVGVFRAQLKSVLMNSDQVNIMYFDKKLKEQEGK